ncbi:MAG: hypothetical protein IT382_04820 [Deltaproteobacteria bacterium]|nr:hypothetical protein [Deltaproteobacteria bacterium]
METSAGISSTLGAAILREQRRAARRQAVMLALVLVAGAALASSLLAGGVATAQAGALARCEDERDRAGVGRRAALRAVDAPERQQRFLYRVASDEGGYRVRLVVKDGPFLGDTWEQDAYGRLRHVHDVCRERFAEELGQRLLARVDSDR